MKLLKSFKISRQHGENKLFVVYVDEYNNTVEEYLFLKSIQSISKKQQSISTDTDVIYLYSIILTFDGGVSHTFSNRITRFQRSDFLDERGRIINKLIRRSYWESEMVVTPPPDLIQFFLRDVYGDLIEAKLIYDLWDGLFPNHQKWIRDEN